MSEYRKVAQRQKEGRAGRTNYKISVLATAHRIVILFISVVWRGEQEMRKCSTSMDEFTSSFEKVYSNVIWHSIFNSM